LDIDVFRECYCLGNSKHINKKIQEKKINANNTKMLSFTTQVDFFLLLFLNGRKIVAYLFLIFRLRVES
jgi:hypothetical protein